VIATAAPVDLRERAEEEQVVLLFAMGYDAEAPQNAIDAARRAGREYRELEQMRLWGFEDDGRVPGIIGVETGEPGLVILRDLAVVLEARRQGIGRRLVEFIRRHLEADSIRGYTWSGAVEFYERCGFAIRKDGVLGDDRPRFLFEWKR
jgi:predicted N-acetyltransferase YhbS